MSNKIIWINLLPILLYIYQTILIFNSVMTTLWNQKVPQYLKTTLLLHSMSTATILCNFYLEKLRNERNQKTLISFFFAYFCRAGAKTLFLRGRLGARCIPMQSLAFPNIVLFPKILSFKWFGNLFGNSCIEFLF